MDLPQAGLSGTPYPDTQHQSPTGGTRDPPSLVQREANPDPPLWFKSSPLSSLANHAEVSLVALPDDSTLGPAMEMNPSDSHPYSSTVRLNQSFPLLHHHDSLTKGSQNRQSCDSSRSAKNVRDRLPTLSPLITQQPASLDLATNQRTLRRELDFDPDGPRTAPATGGASHPSVSKDSLTDTTILAPAQPQSAPLSSTTSARSEQHDEALTRTRRWEGWVPSESESKSKSDSGPLQAEVEPDQTREFRGEQVTTTTSVPSVQSTQGLTTCQSLDTNHQSWPLIPSNDEIAGREPTAAMVALEQELDLLQSASTLLPTPTSLLPRQSPPTTTFCVQRSQSQSQLHSRSTSVHLTPRAAATALPIRSGRSSGSFAPLDQSKWDTIHAQLNLLRSEVHAMHLANDELERDNRGLHTRLTRATREQQEWQQQFTALYTLASQHGVPLNSFPNPPMSMPMDPDTPPQGGGYRTEQAEPRKRSYNHSLPRSTPKMGPAALDGISSHSTLGLSSSAAWQDPMNQNSLQNDNERQERSTTDDDNDDKDEDDAVPMTTVRSGMINPVCSSQPDDQEDRSTIERNDTMLSRTTQSTTQSIERNNTTSSTVSSPPTTSTCPTTPLDLPVEPLSVRANPALPLRQAPHPNLSVPHDDPTTLANRTEPHEVRTFLNLQTERLVACVGKLLSALRHPTPDVEDVGLTLREMISIVHAVSQFAWGHQELLLGPSRVLTYIWNRWQGASSDQVAYDQLDKPALAKACWALAKALKALDRQLI